MLCLLLAMALGPLLITGLLAGNYGKSLLKKSIGANLHMVAHAIIGSIDQRIEQRRETVQMLATYPYVQEAAARGSFVFPREREIGPARADEVWQQVDWPDNPMASAKISQVLTTARAATGDLVEIFLTDRDGWLVGSTNKTEDFFQADEAWWTQAAAAGCGGFHIDDLHYDDSAEEYVTTIAMAVCVNDRFVGVLRAGLAFSHMVPMMSKLSAGRQASVLVVKRDGTIVASIDGSGLQGDHPLSARPVLEAAQALGESRSGFLEAPVRGVPSVIGHAVSDGTGQFAGFGWTALVVEPTSQAYAPVVALQRAIWALSLLLLVTVLLVGLRTSAGLTDPIRRAAEVMQSIAGGDLTGTLHSTGHGEMDQLAESLNDMTVNLRAMVGSIRGTAVDVESASRSVARGSGRVVTGSHDQIQQVAQTNSLIRKADLSLDTISASVQEMVDATDRSAESLAEMEVNIGELVQSTGSLSDNTRVTVGHIQGMVTSIQQVDTGVNDLRTLAETTAAAVTQMDSAIRSIETIADRTSTVTARTAIDAESGRLAVERTLAGMVEIEQASGRTSDVIGRLTEQIDKVGSILEIITDVTDQTNLLALNASILAAQAGEQGRGFAVVADEIKQLAERTALSTGEITTLVRSIQTGSAEAARSTTDGSQHIITGVERAREAGEALLQILDSARESSDMVEGIVDATREHSSQSHGVASAMQHLQRTVAEIAQAVQLQAAGCASIMTSSGEIGSMTERVRRAIVDQQERSGLIARSVELISGMAKVIDRDARSQKGLSRDMMASIGRIEDVSGENLATIGEVDRAVRALTEHAEKLRAQIAFFREQA